MRVLIAAGGTAGHINPALAIAGALKKRHPDAEIHFAGRQKGMEYGLVSKAGYAFHPIEVNGIQRRLTPKNIARNLVALWHLALSGPRAGAILREVKPDLVIGAGGYVSGPVVQAAQRRGIPTAIHEQNAFPGVTNKILAKHASAVLAAMPEDEAEMILTHNEQEIRFVLKTDFSALRGFLAEARRKGYASAQGMLLEGTIGVSHVLRMGNEAVGSIAIDAVRSEQWDKDQPKIIQELQSALS